MYVVIVGGGRVGYYLTKALLAEGHEILVIEKNAAVCETINDELGSICYRGDGCEVAILSEVGTGRADMIIAVTGDDEDNLVACQVAKNKFKVPRTIARIRNPKNETIFKKLGIDVTVSSTDVILEHIEEEVPTHPLTHLLEIRDKGVEIVEVRIPSNSPIIGKPMKGILLPPENQLVLVIPQEGKPHVPTANTIFSEGDHIIALTTPEFEEALRATLRGGDQTETEKQNP